MEEAYLSWSMADDMILLNTMKGSNPKREKHPAIKCPLCNKFMYYVRDKRIKNDILCFDIDAPEYSDLPRNFVRVCRGCHHHIGILMLDEKLRKLFDLPPQHKCHEKITV